MRRGQPPPRRRVFTVHDSSRCIACAPVRGQPIQRGGIGRTALQDVIRNWQQHLQVERAGLAMANPRDGKTMAARSGGAQLTGQDPSAGETEAAGAGAQRARCEGGVNGRIEFDGADLTSLRLVICGGAPVPAGALMDRWNRTPGNHNVVSSTWFVYDSPSNDGTGWDTYSIEYWKTHGGTGAGDLYQAFFDSARAGYKAGVAGTRHGSTLP